MKPQHTFVFIIRDTILKTEHRMGIKAPTASEARKEVIKALRLITRNFNKYRAHYSIRLDAPDNAARPITQDELTSLLETM
jgi:hypothetical protein